MDLSVFHPKYRNDAVLHFTSIYKAPL
ncbi:hypothetical protein NSMM_160003 [Nitrosomonas mobilis]|uniref:Uncharacterized protein n=1 Tax=Nitrosomonas mobilis TaxID=51642 RepID=A0A1G5SB44_9PROT|nr:hypothetical protein NSMM_160003 [Nitrosomonas mobilis]